MASETTQATTTPAQKRARLLGETVREFGILIGVFGPLDAFFQSTTEKPLDPWVVTVFASISVLLGTLGIVLEARNEV